MAADTAYEHITVDIDGGVATIAFHRPAVHNALNGSTMDDLRRAFEALDADRTIDVVIITGEGDAAFSAGADIEEYAGPAAAHHDQRARQRRFFEHVYTAPHDLHCPTIAKINGYCVGGGLILALWCDLRVAADHAEFAIPTTDIGQTPGGGATYRAIQLVGEAAVKELVFTAGRIDAAAAHRLGLVNRVVPPVALDEAVDDLVGTIQSTGRRAVKNAKRAINGSAGAPDREAAFDQEVAVWWEQFSTAERERLVDQFTDP